MICTDCKGTGQYQGLLSVETCQKCAGTGQIGVISCEQVSDFEWEVKVVEVVPTEAWSTQPVVHEKEALKEAVERYQHGLQRYLILSGGSAFECYGEDK